MPLWQAADGTIVFGEAPAARFQRQPACTRRWEAALFYAAPFVLQTIRSSVFKVLLIYSFDIGGKVERYERERLKPGTPNHWGRDPVACGGLKPLYVISRYRWRISIGMTLILSALVLVEGPNATVSGT
jgi:hypothetical protein